MLHIPIVHTHDVRKQIKSANHRVENVIKQLVHMSAVCSLRYEALGKFGEHSRSSPNFPCASYLDECKLTYEPIVNVSITKLVQFVKH